MERREFVRTAVAGAALRATAGPSAALRSAQDDNLGAKAQQEFYQLRKYELRNGPQTALTQGYFEKALIPALGRLGIGPVGAFKLDIGPQTPTYYVLIPGDGCGGAGDAGCAPRHGCRVCEGGSGVPRCAGDGTGV